MNKVQIVQTGTIVIGAIIALSLVSKHPVHIGILAVCACIYLIVPKILK